MGLLVSNIDHYFQFDLLRRSGKNAHPSKGNQMVSANDTLHYAPKGIIVSQLREMAKDAGAQYKKENGYENNKPIYSQEQPCHVIITINPPTNAHMDAPNWYPTIKALMDGLTDAEIFYDDDDSIIKSLSFFPGKVTGNGMYNIELSLVDGTPPLLLKQITLKEFYNK